MSEGFNFEKFQTLLFDLPNFKFVAPKAANPSEVYLLLVGDLAYIGPLSNFRTQDNRVQFWGDSLVVDLVGKSANRLGSHEEVCTVQAEPDSKFYIPSNDLIMFVGKFLNNVN